MISERQTSDVGSVTFPPEEDTDKPLLQIMQNKVQARRHLN